MMFKKSIIAASLLLTVGQAMAVTDSGVAGGTITFSGMVTDTTCNVTTNKGADFTVDLSPVTTDQVGVKPGVVTHNAQKFTMHVSGCKSSKENASALKITFSSPHVSDDELYLKNSTGTAEGVGIALTTDGSKAIEFDKAVDTGVKADAAGSEAGADVSFFANYYNYGGSNIATGNIVTTATYTFNYE
ncbi:fimbrial protein [Klebsiella michiganensis]|uniref:fimbrial protein n=1 Tax=Klebsiella michiganensis TaxID=1134687 RepID=UPI003D99B4B2